jgi:hypothetical protein
VYVFGASERREVRGHNRITQWLGLTEDHGLIHPVKFSGMTLAPIGAWLFERVSSQRRSDKLSHCMPVVIAFSKTNHDYSPSSRPIGFSVRMGRH